MKLRVKHKESGKEYEVYKIEKEKSGTYILIYKEQATYETYIPHAGAVGKERVVMNAGWVWDDIDSYEPVQEYDIEPIVLKSSEQSNEKILEEIKKFKLFGNNVE